jgi:hypothetical protein
MRFRQSSYTPIRSIALSQLAVTATLSTRKQIAMDIDWLVVACRR